MGGAIAPESQLIKKGSSATLTVTPDENYNIASVSGCDGSLAGDTYTTGPIYADCTVSASFSLITYNVSTTTSVGGSITPPDQVVDHGSVASFTVTPDEGYSIDSVAGCGGALAGDTYTTAPIIADCTVSANFSLNTYLVSTTSSVGGAITPPDQLVDHGAVASFTVTPDAGYVTTGVTGCGGTLAGDTYTTGAITAACTVDATFDLATYSVSGTVSGLAPGQSVLLQNNGGDDFIVDADGGFTFSGVLYQGDSYRVSVASQPTGQWCSVKNGVGTIESADITDITVSCGLPPCAAVFANTSYVDYIPGNSAAEASNMEAILSAAGFEVSTFTGTTAADFTAAVSGCAGPVTSLVIPEQEKGNLAAVLTAAEQTAIADFVNGGGNLIVVANNTSSSAVELVNGVFGWASTETAVGADIFLDGIDAPGTPFEGGTTVGGTVLPAPSATEAFTAADLPLDARSIYTDANGNAVVAMVRVNSGTVTMLGWDYFGAAPVGATDGGWLEVLSQAAAADALEMQIPLTNVAQADVEAKGWTTCHTETYATNGTVIADLFSGPCAGTEVMLACRQSGSPDLTLAARATLTDMTVDTGSADNGITNDVGGISWYYNDSWSWGFASLGDSVDKFSCDTNTTGKNDQRMCWHTGSGQISSGWRCGTSTYLNDSTAWERVILAR